MTEPTDDRDVSTIMQVATIEPSDEFLRSLALRIRADLTTTDAPTSTSGDSTWLGRRGRVLLAAATTAITAACCKKPVVKVLSAFGSMAKRANFPKEFLCFKPKNTKLMWWSIAS